MTEEFKKALAEKFPLPEEEDGILRKREAWDWAYSKCEGAKWAYNWCEEKQNETFDTQKTIYETHLKHKNKEIKAQQATIAKFKKVSNVIVGCAKKCDMLDDETPTFSPSLRDLNDLLREIEAVENDQAR